jgi:hypothetical protein
MRCAPRREKHRLSWFLNLSFGWNHRLNPPPTAQFIAVVSLSNSGTVPRYLIKLSSILLVQLEGAEKTSIPDLSIQFVRRESHFPAKKFDT